MEEDRPSDNAARPNRAYVTNAGWYWLGGMLLVAVGSQLLGTYHRSTILVPQRTDAISMAFVFGFLSAGLSVVLGLYETNGPTRTKLACGVLVFGAVGFLAPFLMLGAVTNLFYARIDFPPEKTRAFRALLPIGRAYKTNRGRRTSTKFNYTIQPTPLWTNIDISRKDWDFMLAERMLNEEASSVQSDGYFCARVEMQQAGTALRVMNAGTYALPEGSIELCPPQTAGLPYLEVE